MIIKRTVCATVLALMAAASAAQAQQRPEPQWWLDVNLGSYHFGDESGFLPPGERFNEFNPGIGVEVQWQPRHAVAAGYFRNSVDRNSLYALYQYTPLQFGRYVRVGGMVGAVTGYPGYNDGGIAPAGGLVVKIERGRIGANLIVLPEIPDVTPTTLGLQVKLRLDR
ncbi:hypothetical protein ACFFGH_03530 [Lysobacter korlensis]|uniref:Outer membrane protein beta-barrel domain-containing protein n=1 Tax=Lysobacter korlensis TaxID=553636 RepID=A0ABV6RIW1_9GAMM